MIASEPTASVVGTHGRWSEKNPRVSISTKPLNGRLNANQNSASAVSSRRLRRPLAALVDEPHHRLAQHQHRRAGGDQQQRDLAQADADRRLQPVVVLAGGEPRELREQHGRHRDAEHALREHVDAERGVDRARHLVADTSEPIVEFSSRLMLISPSPTETGSISSSTRLTRSSPRLREPDVEDRVADPPQRREHHQQLHERARDDADRVGVELVRRPRTAAPARPARR